MKLSCKIVLLSLTCVTLSASDEISLYFPVPASGAEMALDTRSKFYEHLNQFCDWLMSLQNLQYETKHLNSTVGQPPKCLIEFEQQHGFFAKSHPLVGQYTPCKTDLGQVENVLKSIDNEVKNFDLRLFYIQEILSKVLAYRNLEIGDRIFIPHLEKSGEFANYQVSEVFDLGFSMPAFALTSKDQSFPSIILYRGTRLDFKDKSGIASIVADLDLYGPGYTAFFKIENRLNEFLVAQEIQLKKTVTMGYSLGGILAVYTKAFFPNLIDTRLSCAFNPPGVQKKLFNLCKNECRLDSFKVYVNQFDPVSKWGFLIGNVEVLSLNQHLGPLLAHTMLMGSQVGLDCLKCDLELENVRHRYFFMPE